VVKSPGPGAQRFLNGMQAEQNFHSYSLEAMEAEKNSESASQRIS
jgi:hypothetical protein